MQQFREVLLKVWREACRHIEIWESVETIAPMLVPDMPIEQLYVRRIDRQRSCVETVALGFPETQQDQTGVHTACSASQTTKLVTWCKRGKIVHCSRGERLKPELRAIVPAALDGDLLIGPLGMGDRSLGVLILAASDRHSFDERHVALAQSILEPLSAALDNDRQLHEINTLREAAEADKRSLLARLGRNEVGGTIVGAASGLRTAMERVKLVARSDVPVLIFGETGTGKELLARAIHGRSARSAGPVIRVNCGAIPPELIDSELFGHERGAFTGAVETRKGWFERADGGTLFLDEIGELPSAAQVRLLRVLQDGWLERVGGQHPINVDVRIVAATHRDLASMVADGKFREDLWYRLAVFPILIPPLRERRDDIPEIARHFARRASTRFTLPYTEPSATHLELLKNYDWPGNVRELAAVIDRAAILGEGKRLEVAKALGAMVPTVDNLNTPTDTNSSSNARREAIAPLDVVIKHHIESVLGATSGRIEGPHGAAIRLRVNPHTLRARMRKLGIDWRKFRDTPGAGS